SARRAGLRDTANQEKLQELNSLQGRLIIIDDLSVNAVSAGSARREAAVCTTRRRICGQGEFLL
ncbi:MAG: hypothetical protein L0K70_04680, partial [Bifidobacterium crudilactis]|nr:hypothetical protein [Bifidobacterium crudilactis]